VSERYAAAIERVAESGGDADAVLREVVAMLAREPGVAWAGIRFLEAGRLVLGPWAGEPDERRRLATPILYRGEPVGELVVDGDAPAELSSAVAELVAEHVLLGWDTQGEPWQP